MFKKLLPRSAPYFDYFDQQNAMLREMSTLLLRVAKAEQDADVCLKKINKLEVEADTIQHTIIHELSQTFITPIDREDIYAVSNAQERVIDSLAQLAARLFLFSFVHTRFPAMKMLENMASMATLGSSMLDSLRHKTSCSEAVKTLRGLKENCEMLIGVGLSELQDAEVTSFDTIKQLMVWSQIYDRIEDSVNLFSELTDTMEQAVLKYA